MGASLKPKPYNKFYDLHIIERPECSHDSSWV